MSEILYPTKFVIEPKYILIDLIKEDSIHRINYNKCDNLLLTTYWERLTYGRKKSCVIYCREP